MTTQFDRAVFRGIGKAAAALPAWAGALKPKEERTKEAALNPMPFLTQTLGRLRGASPQAVPPVIGAKLLPAPSAASAPVSGLKGLLGKKMPSWTAAVPAAGAATAGGFGLKELLGIAGTNAESGAADSAFQAGQAGLDVTRGRQADLKVEQLQSLLKMLGVGAGVAVGGYGLSRALAPRQEEEEKRPAPLL